MKKVIKRTLATLMTMVMLLTAIPFAGTASAKDISSCNVGDVITYGSYPQSKVTDSSTLTALNSISKSWISYGYYSGTGSESDGQMKPSDYMKYCDISYNGNKYRAVTFSQYRPNCTGYTLSSNTYQAGNGYYTGNVYYFRYDPLTWRVLDPSEGFVMCTTAIDAQAYNNYIVYKNSNSEYYGNSSKTYYASDWANSSIRYWLNNDFYSTAFSSTEKSQIDTTYNENKSIRDSRYDSANTSDKIFLLSYNELLNSKYGFTSRDSSDNSARQLKSTDYAKCQGCYQCTDSSMSYHGNRWRLRSPSNSRDAVYVSDNGYAYGGGIVNDTSHGIVPAFKFNPKSTISESNDTKIEFTTDTQVIPLGSIFNISASFSSSTLNPSSKTISYKIEDENGGIESNGSISVIGSKENAIVSASFIAKKIGDYKVYFETSDGAESSIDICIVSDTYDKYMASSLIKLRSDRIKNTKMLYGYLYDEGLTFGDGVKSFLRVKDFSKDPAYYYELVIMDILFNSTKDSGFESVVEGEIESITKKLISYGLKYSKYTSQSAFENTKIANLSASEITSLKSSFEKADVMCDGFSDASTLMSGISTIKDYIDSLSRYAALQNVKQGYIDILRGISIVIQYEKLQGTNVNINAACFAGALDRIADYYENYNISVADCFKKSAGDLIWGLVKEVINEGVKYIVGGNVAAIMTITKETVNLVWQVFEPTKLIVGEATLKCTIYFENRLKNFLDSLSAQYEANETLSNAVKFNDCYSLLLSCFTYGNSVHSSVEDISYNGTPGGTIGSLISSSKRATHFQVCEYINKSNKIVENEYSFIKNTTENYKSYIYGTNMRWTITLDYNADLKNKNIAILYDYSNVSSNLTQFFFDGEPVYLSSYKPTRNGYDFKGWYYDKGCTKQFSEGTKASEDLTLYAKWMPTALYNVKDLKSSKAEMIRISPQFGIIRKTKVLKASATSTENTYIVPAYIDGFEIVSLADNMIVDNESSINSVIIPDTVTYIGKNAFANCDSLQNITIPASVKEIADGAFDDCVSINNVVFAGTEEQWKKIFIGKDNEALCNAEVIYAPMGKVKSVSIDDINLNYKKSTTLKPTVDADSGVKYNVTYESSNPKIATVDDNGKVTATKRGKGSATITCTVTDEFGNTVKDTCNVNVSLSFGQKLIVYILFGWIWY